MTASAWVHCRYQLEPGWIGDVSLGPRDADAASLERLAERFECGTVELRQFVEEKQPYYTTQQMSSLFWWSIPFNLRCG